MRKSLTVFYAFILTCLVSALGFFTYNYFQIDDVVYVPDFNNATFDDVKAWCDSLNNSPCSITYENSNDVEINRIIYQSLNTDQELTDSISFIISLGKMDTIVLPIIDSSTTREIIEAWAKDNELVNIKFIPEASETIEKGIIIKIEPTEITSKDSSISVYVSSGKPQLDSIEVKTNEYVDLTVDEFEKKAKELGLNPVHASEKDVASTTIKEGKIVWHGSGFYVKDETFRYGISKGESAINVIKGEYVGLSIDDFRSEIEKLGTKGLKIIHNAVYDSYSSTVSKDSIVYHGSGDFKDEDELEYGVSLGLDENKIIVSYGSFLNMSPNEVETIVSSLGKKGLVPNHNADRDAYSDTISKGNVVWHGSGEYDEEEKFNYGLSLGASGDDNKKKEIIVSQGTYIGKTLDEFKKEVASLGLVPYHREEWDVKDSNKSNNVIARNGFGTYITGENISYGLFINEDGTDSANIVVSKGQYVGKTLDEFKTICSNLGIVPEHSEVYSDAYSDTIAKGSLDYHGSGTYVKGEVIHYTLSLGKKDQAPSVNVSSYAGKTESEFINYINSLKLQVGTRNVTYSNSVASGYIISNDTGSFIEGSYVNYTVSLGKDNRINVLNYAGKSELEFLNFLSSNGLIANKKEENSSSVTPGIIISNDTGLYETGDIVSYILSLGKAQYKIELADSYNSFYSEYNTYDKMYEKLSTNPFRKFTNVSYVKGNHPNFTSGMIISISINGDTAYSPGLYDSDATIIITIAQ